MIISRSISLFSMLLKGNMLLRQEGQDHLFSIVSSYSISEGEYRGKHFMCTKCCPIEHCNFLSCPFIRLRQKLQFTMLCCICAILGGREVDEKDQEYK